MKIDKIVKMRDNKYKIYIDGDTIITYDNVILNNDLLYKKNIDKDLYNKIISENDYYNIYNKTVKYISKKRRSEIEISKYLDKFDITKEDKEKIIIKLKDLNFINDIEFCKAFINDRIYLSNNGINKIKIDLLRHNIPIEVIENQLNNIDSSIINDKLEKLIIKKINSNHKYSNYHLKQKILNEMINLGYSKDIILEIIDKNIIKDDNIIKSEFDKVYDKLKLKYSGNEFEIKLKQKLISRGFELEKINTLLQEKTED